MKRIFYTLVLLIAVGLVSCKKSNEVSILQFDDSQIQGYIQQNNIKGMVRDTSSGDTTGIYYQILNAGTGPVVDYPDEVSYVYTYQTFDGEYSTTDTIANHAYNFLGHVTPPAIQLSIKNIMKRKGTKVRLLIPSRLAFGRDGYFAGAVHINGNECLDYTINLLDGDYDAVAKINHQAVYDQISIQKYMAANSLTGYTQTPSGLWYKITQAGTGTAAIGFNSTVGLQYTGYLFDGIAFDTETNTDLTVSATTFYTLYSLIPGFSEGLSHITQGGSISLIMPSTLAYQNSGSTNSVTGVTVPAFSCLRFDIYVVSVTN